MRPRVGDQLVFCALPSSNEPLTCWRFLAIGRIRRYGQTKTVHIWRYIASGTIDEEIYEKYDPSSLAQLESV
jgi:hypothetical protein